MGRRAEARIRNNLFLSFSSKVNQIVLVLYEFHTPPPVPFTTSSSSSLPFPPPQPPSPNKIDSAIETLFVVLARPEVNCATCILMANLNSFASHLLTPPQLSQSFSFHITKHNLLLSSWKWMKGVLGGEPESPWVRPISCSLNCL